MATHRRPWSAETDWKGAIEALKVPQPQRDLNKPPLLRWNALQEWQRDNAYILGYYRPASYSYYRSFQSLFYLHNEAVNIHSHLLGAFLFFSMSISIYAFRTYPVSAGDIIAFGCFFIGAVVCLGMSATYHLISNHSPQVSRFGNQLDYVGIVALITGSFIPSVYYGFYCEPVLQKIYWGMASPCQLSLSRYSQLTCIKISLMGIGCTVVSLDTRFRTPKWRPFRALMFIAMGLSAVFPVIHGLLLYGIRSTNDRIGLSWVVLQGVLYGVGAGLYATRFPERLNPGKYDLYGSSHQIFHVLILFAALAQLIGLLKAFEHAQLSARC